MRWEKVEINRAVLDRKMTASLLIGFFAMMYGGTGVLSSPNVDFIDTFIFAQTDNTTALMGLIFPIIAVLPIGASYRDERSCGYYFLLRTKILRKRYLRIKLIVSALSGAIAVGIPNLLYLILVMIIKGIYADGESDVALSFLTDIYYAKPLAYAGLLVINAAVCGAVFAVLGMGISAWVKNKYLAMILPFAYYIFSGMVLSYVNPHLNAISLFSVNQYQTANGFAIFTYDLILLLTGVILFITGVVYEDEWQ